MAPSPGPIPDLFPPSDGGHHTWPAPNYVDPETRSWAGPACLIAFYIITIGIFFARLWARFRITRTPGVDDWLIIATMPILLGMDIAIVLGLRIYGFQLHIWDQTPKTNITIRQITLSIEILYVATTAITKISILSFYRRITGTAISRWLVYTVWGAIFAVAAWGITFVFVLLFTCWPVEAYWYRFTVSWLKTHTYKCHDEVVALIIIISIGTFQDFCVCILPMFFVRKLRLPTRTKLALYSIFLIGLFTCGTGCLRVYYSYKLYYLTHIHTDPLYDISWQAYGSWIATAVEANVAVICASAPALRVYFIKWLAPVQPPIRDFGWHDEKRHKKALNLVSGTTDSGYASGTAQGPMMESIDTSMTMSCQHSACRMVRSPDSIDHCMHSNTRSTSGRLDNTWISSTGYS